MRKIEISPYSSNFPKKFKEVKKEICKTFGEIDIHHIGSTAVPDLPGKGIIDVLIGVKNWKEGKDIVKKLRRIGFTHVHPKEKGRIFLSSRKESKLGDVHIHMVRKGTKQYRELLGFRDFLRKNKKEREKYLEIKKKLIKKTINREEYNKLKGKYVKLVLRRISKK